MRSTVKTLSRAITWSAACATLLLFSACGATRTPDLGGTTILDITKPQDLTTFSSLMKGETLEKPVIIKAPKGFSLPVRILLETPLATMESDCSQMEFKEDLFLWASKNEMLVSPDLKRWAKIGEIEAVKELFGGERGEVAVSMGSDAQRGTALDIKIAVHPKGR